MSSLDPSPSPGLPRWTLGLALALGTLALGVDVWHAVAAREAEDVLLQWQVAQYVRAGIDPYHVGNCIAEGLQAAADEAGVPLQLYRIPADASHQECCGVLLDVGGPTATYPPSATALWTVLVGWLPRTAVLPLWAVINVACVGLLAWLLRRWARQWGRDRWSAWETLAILLGLTATHISIGNSQFSLLVMAALLAFLLTDRPWLAGVCLGLALMKPTLSLPFVLVPLVRRQWTVLAVAGGLQLSTGLLLSAVLDVDLLTLTREWLGLGSYFMTGMYSLHEVLVVLGLQASSLGPLLLLAIGAAAGTWLALHRPAPLGSQVEFLAVVTLVWTHHGTYDFVLIALLVVGILARWREQGRCSRVDLALLSAALLVTLALPHAVVAGAEPWHRALRWAGRLACLALLPLTAWNLSVLRRGPAPSLPGPWKRAVQKSTSAGSGWRFFR